MDSISIFNPYLKEIIMDKTCKNAAIYARVSSDKQDVDLSISAQLRSLREYAEHRGYTLAREFVDEAESGRTAARPAFRDMISLARTKNPPFNVILVWKLNRFARSRADSITYKTLLRNKGIDVISINEPVEDSPTGRLLEGVIESIDEFYSDNLGQDIRRGMRENASRGFFNGSRPPYGLHKVDVHDRDKIRHRLEPDPEDSVTTKTVRHIFDMALKDLGCKEIAKTLNQEGSRTKNGERWGRTTVYQVLTNEAYKGTLVWAGRHGRAAERNGETAVRVDKAWSAIIEPTNFQIVQQKMSAKRPEVTHPRTVPSTYLLSGMLFCACGRAMIGHSAKCQKHFYYLCSRKFKQGNEACNTKRLPKVKLEKVVVEHIKSEVLNDDNLEKMVLMSNDEFSSASSGLKERLEIIDAEIHDVRARLSKLYDAIETGKVALDDLSSRIRELKARQEELSKTRVLVEAEMVAKGEEQINMNMVKTYAKDLRVMIEEASFTERKAFLRSFIKRIEINKEKVKVTHKLPLPNGGEHIAVLPIDTFGGDRGIRTPDLRDANATLSRLSHIPNYMEIITYVPIIINGDLR
jgi:site-specific DNA recombinase